MDDVLFYQNYSPVGDICTMAVCIVYWYLLSSTYTVKHRNLTTFKIANSMVLIAAMCSVIYHHLVMNDARPATVPWIYVCRDTAFIALALTNVMLITYIGNLVEIKGRYRKLLDLSIWAMFAAFSVFEVLTPVTKLGFWMDADLQVHQNFYLEPFWYVYIYYSCITMALLVYNKRKLITKMYRCICSIFIISFVLIAIQTFFVQSAYTCLSFTLPIMALLFLFHYNAYDTKTGTLDSQAFDAYVKELGSNKFSIIFFYLRDMNIEKMQGLSENFYHFHENFFMESCSFRLRDEKLAMVYKDVKNPKADEKFAELVQDFDKLYAKHRMDYRIVLIHADDRLVDGRDYLHLDEYMEEQLPINTVYQCEKEDVTVYLRARYIQSELRDINRRQDLDDERVQVYCQPVYDLKSNSFTSAEALMRLKLPDCGLVYPDQFIPLAEKYDLIHTLSKIILNKTCKYVYNIVKQGYRLERVSVNFSMVELRDPDFCNDVLAIIRNNHVPYSKIALELTESRNEKDFKAVKKVMAQMQELGVRFYLDDFGTGYSNFERIIGLPIDIIKFDRSLTVMAGKNEESRFMVGSFSDIFKRSNYQILFEGVENAQDEEQCKDMNAQYLQGYKYSKPVPMAQLVDFLDREEL